MRSTRAIFAAERLFRAAAVSNAVVTIPAFVAYNRYVSVFAKGKPPNYPFLVRIWAGMALLWGVSFWQISRDPIAHRELIRYAPLEKLVTTLCVVDAYRRGEVPAALVAMVVLTDAVWIPPFVAAGRSMARASV